jgi:hypothetical protein
MFFTFANTLELHDEEDAIILKSESKGVLSMGGERLRRSSVISQKKKKKKRRSPVV